MAAQAASSAAGGVSSGATAVASSAAAGSAAAAAGTAAAVGTAQVVTAIVATAAVASTATVLTTNEAVVDIFSTCGIINPTIYSGSFQMSFDGFEGPFDKQQTRLVESVVVDAYNFVTRGKYIDNDANETIGCVDKYLREMQSATLIDQIFGVGDEKSTLDLTFESRIICEGCPLELPLFGTYTREDDTIFDVIGLRLMQETSSVAFLDASFIRAHLEEVVRRIIRLIESKELPETFIASTAYWKTSDSGTLENNPNLDAGAEDASLYYNDGIIVNVPIITEADGDEETIEVIFGESSCGISNPDFFAGTFHITFEGITDTFAEDQIVPVEQMVVESYNKVTRGENVNEDNGCSDPYLRELSAAKLVDQQIYFLLQEGNGEEISVLDLLIEGWVTCQDCVQSSPFFGIKGTGEDSVVTLDKSLVQQYMEEVVLGLIDLMKAFELPPSFVPTGINIVIESEDAFGGSVAVSIPINLEYDEDGDITVDFPEPSESPSKSARPSESPSNGPTIFQSAWPSASPTVSESPTVSSSASPTESAQPSDVPSSYPSARPSAIPSVRQSEVPSTIPSVFPSSFPSNVPSEVPSDVPSSAPSPFPTITDAPTSQPSQEPSQKPSDFPSVSIRPSQSPSDVPSTSQVPSQVPSEEPSEYPSLKPSDSPSVSIRPSQSPSDIPSTSQVPSQVPLPPEDPSESPSTSAGPSSLIWVDGSWAQLGQDIVGGAGDILGASVSISDDGQTVAIGAPFSDIGGSNTGYTRVLVYDVPTDDWIPLGQTIISSLSAGAEAGSSVSLSHDGRTVAIGGPNHNGNSGYSQVLVYDVTTDNWIPLGSTIFGQSGDLEGASVSLSSDGRTVAIGAPYSDIGFTHAGHARVFFYDETTDDWIPLGPTISGLQANDSSGYHLSLSSDGRTVAIGAYLHNSSRGYARIFAYDVTTDDWDQLGSTIFGGNPSDNLGYSVSMSNDGRTVAIGAFGYDNSKGNARVWTYDETSNGGEWIQVGSEIVGVAADVQQGRSLSLSGNGKTLAVDAMFYGSDQGHVRIFALEEASESPSASPI